MFDSLLSLKPYANHLKTYGSRKKKRCPGVIAITRGLLKKGQRIDLAINDFIENPCMKTMILTKPKMAMHETIGISIGARIPVAEIIGKHISPEIMRRNSQNGQKYLEVV